ncbi:MFS transporter [Paenibacillus spiritus]|uniref:MFS transporter n=1 Tax=Paenibacillus spiritus TaxID=2496557 RepID=A0A5J5GEP8_9BACL|nr:MFS transporter [Paenibacillus spiritus]KAA9006561.1 MFS transporter [Paenibacillus spiritus]
MKSHLRGIHPLAWTIILGTLFGRLVSSMSIPFLSIYLVRHLGASTTQTGMTIAVSSLAGVLVSFYGGYISDIIGRKKVMLFSIFGWASVFVAFSGSTVLWMFFVVNTLNGLCRALFEPTSRALLSDITSPDKKLLIFNLRYAAINIGVVFGPLVGAQLGSTENTFPFLLGGIVYVLYGLVLIFQFSRNRDTLPVPERVEAPRLREAMAITGRDPVFLPVLLGTVFCVLGYAHFGSTMSQYLVLSPHFTNGGKLFSYMLSLNAVIVLVVQFPLVRSTRNLPPVVPLMIGNLCICGSMLMFGAAQGVALLMAGVVVFTVGEVLIFTMMDMLIDRIAKPQWKGTYFGTIGFNGFGYVLAPVMGGMMLDQFGAGSGPALFIPLAITTALGLPLLWLAHRRLMAREAAEAKEEQPCDTIAG